MEGVESDVIDAARYLRSVRAIDPAELTEYTAEPVDATMVATILRRHACSLALIERADGTFIPAETTPIEGSLTPLSRLPERIERFLEDRLIARHGTDWATGGVADGLRARIAQLKARYLDGGQIEYDRDDADAYLIYHFPRSFAATWYVLSELLEAGHLSRSLRILDVGAGVGANLAAVDALTPDDAFIEYRAIEPSPLSVHLEAVADQLTGMNTHVTIEREAVEALSSDTSFNLAMMGNVLSELEEPAVVASTVLDQITADGSWVAIAPADPRTSIQLRHIERDLEDRAGIFSPTIRLWPDRRPTDECWSFVEQPALAVPRVQGRLGSVEDGGAFINNTIRYSYAIMRPDRRRRHDITASESNSLPLFKAPDAVGERVDLIAVKLSADLAEEGNPVYRIGDGSQQEPCFATAVTTTPMNEALSAAPYGAVLRFGQTLVLWNDDEAAINLVVDDETTVDRLTH